MRVFHGMTEKAFKAYLSGSDESGIIGPWTCSDNDGNAYLYPIEHGFNECSTDCEDEAANFCIQAAKESATIQAAINDDGKVFVFDMTIPDELLEVDYSCENMQFCRFTSIEVFREYAKNAHIHNFSINRALHIFRVAGLIHNCEFNSASIDPELYEAAKLVSKIDCSQIYDSLY